MAALPSAAGIFLSRVWVPLSVPFSTVKVGTTLCQTLAGSAPSKSSENRSSFFLAIGSVGTGGRSAAQVVEMRRKEKANKQRSLNRVVIVLLIYTRLSCQSKIFPAGVPEHPCHVVLRF